MSTSEVGAIKVEIAELMRRRMTTDRRSPSDLFATACCALSESLADMLFAAARNEEHGRDLLATANAIIESRWNALALRHPK